MFRLFLLVQILFLIGCHQNEDVWEDMTLIDCFPDGETIKIIKDQEAIVSLHEDLHFLICVDAGGNNTTNYFPCNLPEMFKADQKKILFSGKVKESISGDDLPGIPLELIKVKVNEIQSPG
ncbi:MAG: hypothetical protein ACNS62_21465 [Candidatus Cyclobacteriaceae bacterium M3_2C_046]